MLDATQALRRYLMVQIDYWLPGVSVASLMVKRLCLVPMKIWLQDSMKRILCLVSGFTTLLKIRSNQLWYLMKVRRSLKHW